MSVATDVAGHLQLALDTTEFAAVFPCRADKAPAVREGFKAATTDRERIERWWLRHPDHLVGIPTAGLVVVDLDLPKPDDARPARTAWDAWERLAGPHGWDANEAVVVTTPSGGWHIYHTDPTAGGVRNSAGKLGPLIDIRAAGGYVIAPGSVLPDGRCYQLHMPASGGGMPVAPGWLLDACTTRPGPLSGSRPAAESSEGTVYGRHALEGELGRLATASAGTRNHALNTAAYRVGQLVAGDQLDLHHATGQLLAVALRIGLSDTEAVATVRSGLQAGTHHPRRPTK